MTSRAPEGMAGLAKGLAILELFGQNRTFLTVSSAADVTGISRASARRCLLTLHDLGYLTKNGPRFLPTPRMLRLGQSYTGAISLPQLAQPQLEAACEELGESVSLSILEDGRSTFVARAEAARIVSTAIRLGTRLPAHAAATGRVLLSGCTEDELDAYFAAVEPAALTAHTVTDKAELRRIIRAAGRDKVAFTDEELEVGMVSMAIPVFDPDGTLVAAMSVSAARPRVTVEDLRDRMLSTLRTFAEALSRSL
ncbi:IclR family transcriptional regulator C-terminal domain-containing protein [Mesorhizobium sp. YIM 152430]|uniref:IclR family transcriptional regulator domain-containing protein n=1 Tax=Mesorhizobium sp. YIM 152430 TaxID=3031761 RepID=UPI0023DC0082|nr:IclR family transcriptional regulator C-terminal domain-containing protein [Mesorhizobium sp. YIM 152430]MDF1598280.1 IclR family transcriptional regulator C-terminal domain-containing protein [Mesorhizobium sp. YIM 152430]